MMCRFVYSIANLEQIVLTNKFWWKLCSKTTKAKSHTKRHFFRHTKNCAKMQHSETKMPGRRTGILLVSNKNENVKVLTFKIWSNPRSQWSPQPHVTKQPTNGGKMVNKCNWFWFCNQFNYQNQFFKHCINNSKTKTKSSKIAKTIPKPNTNLQKPHTQYQN